MEVHPPEVVQGQGDHVPDVLNVDDVNGIAKALDKSNMVLLACDLPEKSGELIHQLALPDGKIIQSLDMVTIEDDGSLCSTEGVRLDSVIYITPTPDVAIYPEETFTCPIKTCTMKITRLDSLDRHLYRHTRTLGKFSGEIALVYQCPVKGCVYEAGNEAKRALPFLKRLKQHYQKTHLPKDFRCGTCNYAFTTKAFLKCHMNNCSSKGPFKCSTCGKPYKTYDGLRRHVKQKSHVLEKKHVRKDDSQRMENLAPENENNSEDILVDLVDTSSLSPPLLVICENLPNSSINSQSSIASSSNYDVQKSPRKYFKKSQAKVIHVVRRNLSSTLEGRIPENENSHNNEAIPQSEETLGTSVGRAVTVSENRIEKGLIAISPIKLSEIPKVVQENKGLTKRHVCNTISNFEVSSRRQIEKALKMTQPCRNSKLKLKNRWLLPKPVDSYPPLENNFLNSESSTNTVQNIGHNCGPDSDPATHAGISQSQTCPFSTNESSGALETNQASIPQLIQNLAPTVSQEVQTESLGQITNSNQPTIIYVVLPLTIIPTTQAQPTLNFGTQTVSPSKHSSRSQHTQTEENLRSNSTSTSSETVAARMKRKRSAETQTRRVRVRISAETQTAVVTKRRRCTLKKSSTETQTQGQQTTPPKLGRASSPSKVLSSTNVVPEQSSSVKIPLTNSFDLFNDLEEVHTQTQTEPDLLLGENFGLDDNLSELLRYVESKSAETQTMIPSQYMEQTVPSTLQYSPSSNQSFVFQEEELFENILRSNESFENAYLTMDSETQTQFDTFPKLL